jgi:hypothetical protein
VAHATSGFFVSAPFFEKKKKKKIQNQASKTIPAMPIFISPHFLPKPIFFLPPSHGFSPTGTGVTPLLFLLSVCIEMEA